MPRNELRKMDGIRQRFTARIVRRGERPGWHSPRPTLLLADVADAETGRPLTDHLWIDDGLWSKSIPDGSVIAFDARVGEYLKGYFGRREDAWDAPPPSVDWKVRRPTKVRTFNPATGEWTAPAKAASPPQAMATAAQIRYLGILQAQTGQPALTPADGLTKGQAATLIDNLTTASANKPTPRQLEYLAALRLAAGQPALTPDSDLTKDQAGELITELVANTPRPQCEGTTLAGHRCRNLVGYTEQYCGSHSAAAEAEKASKSARAARIPANRCQATTLAGEQCKRPASGSNGFCRAHQPPPPPPTPPPRCIGADRIGQQCQATAVKGSEHCRKHQYLLGLKPLPHLQPLPRCQGRRKNGQQCRGQALSGRSRCSRKKHHWGTAVAQARCQGIEVDGSQCTGGPQLGKQYCRRHKHTPISDRPKTVRPGWQPMRSRQSDAPD